MSLHEVLGVAENASPDEIKKAYRRKAQKCHPDVGGDKEEFKQLTVAYEVLSDEDKRRRYEETGNADTESARSFVHVAVEFFNRALQKALQDDPVYLDIVGMALKEVSEIERDLLSQITQTEVDKGKLVKVLKRLKRKCRKKKGEEDVLKSSVEALKTELERRTVMLESKLDTLQQAKEYLQRYEYNYEQRSNGWPDNCTNGFRTFHFKLG